MEYYIDGRVMVTGRIGHIFLGNPIKLSTALGNVYTNVTELQGNPYTFTNGLTAALTPNVGTEVRLGGEIVNNTTLEGNDGFDISFLKIKLFTASSINNQLVATTSNIIKTVNPPAKEDCTFKVETDAFSFISTDSIGNSLTYELPSNQASNEGDVMVMNTSDKAVFTPYERDVTLEAIASLTVGTQKFFYLPFNTGDWKLKRITLWSDGVTTGDSIKLVIQDNTGTPITSEATIAMTEKTLTQGIGYSEAITFTHSGAPEMYYIEITSAPTVLPYGTSYITLTFTKSF